MTDIDLVQDLRMDADMLKDGFQKNLTELWHSDVVKQAAINALRAAEVIEQYRADAAYDECTINFLKGEKPSAVQSAAVNVEQLAIRHLSNWGADTRHASMLAAFANELLRASAQAGADPFNRKQVEAVCRAVCAVEGIDPDSDVYDSNGSDPQWSRYADAVAKALVVSSAQREAANEDANRSHDATRGR